MRNDEIGSANDLGLLQRAYACAINAVLPEAPLADVLGSIDRHSDALVLGAGKAAAAMAAAFHAHWEAPVRGLVVTRYAHGLNEGETSGAIEVVEAGHPSPDSASVAAGARLLRLAADRKEGERLFFLISGGGSALAAAPLPGISFEQKRAAADFLIKAGADIREINCVRKHLSGLKGGRLAMAARPARVTTVAISDVPGDQIADIASGPTIADPSTQADAISILERHEYSELAGLRIVLDDAALETPKPSDAGFASDDLHLIASAATAMDAAAAMLREEAYRVVYLGDDLDDEAKLLGSQHAELAKAELASGKRTAILSGGETRVVLNRSGGRGGRNLEYLAGLALALNGTEGIFALAADTDGIDGHGDHAGGMVTPSMLEIGAGRKLSLATKLADHDCYSFFEACDLLIKTGPTRTNVNDFRLILCHP